MDIREDFQLINHLRYNAYPPRPDMYKACMDAINACNEDDWEREITLPNGKTVDAYTLAEHYKLDFWLEDY